jgi:hypothetical protein
MTNTQRRWNKDFAAASAAIPSGWIWTDEADGWQGIDPEHASHPLVRIYVSLTRVGYANGWI